jgi:hypothetical protein
VDADSRNWSYGGAASPVLKARENIPHHRSPNMPNANLTATQRRSSRVPVNMPILVTGLEPGTHFSEICETMVVSAHGCAMRSPVKLDPGMQVHFHSEEGRQTTAHLVHCMPIDADGRGWMLGARLDQPDNFWGLKTCPADWARYSSTATKDKVLSRPPSRTLPATQMSPVQQTAQPAQRPVPDDRLRALMAEMLRPLQAELAELKGKLIPGEPRRSSFEVSLSQIPPELEQQLESRLKKELWPRMLDQARQQTSEVLEIAKASIEQKTAQSHREFLHRVTQELQGVEQKAQAISASGAESLREHLREASAELDSQFACAGSRLKQLSEEHLQQLQNSLAEEHKARSAEVHQLKSVVASESLRLQQQVDTLDRRVVALDGVARRLESDLDRRLVQLADEIIRKAQGELAGAANVLLKDLETRATEELGNQIDKACSHLDIIQKGVEVSVSDSLRSRTEEALTSFETAMQDLAQQSAARWGHKVAAALNSLAKSIGAEFQRTGEENESGGEKI